MGGKAKSPLTSLRTLLLIAGLFVFLSESRTLRRSRSAVLVLKVTCANTLPSTPPDGPKNPLAGFESALSTPIEETAVTTK